MNKEQQKERETNVRVLADNFPNVRDPVALQNDLYKLGRRCQLNAEKLCNESDYSDKRDTLREELAKIEKKHGVTLRACVSGDPRGYCLKVMLPNGQYNTLGGTESGWGF